MAITVNGAILRNMPEQISKNVEDIAELQDTNENFETRITALENETILAATFEDTTMIGTTTVNGTALNVSVPATFTNTVTAASITVTSLTAGSLAVSGDETITGTLNVSGSSTFSGGISGNLAVSGNITMGGEQVGKKIYCHPIHIESNESGRFVKLTCLIFNNSSTEFTLATFKTFIDNLVASTNSRARIMCSGGTNQIKATSDASGTSKILIASSIDKTTLGNYLISGMDIDGSSNSYADADFYVVFPLTSTFIDGVNAIN